jgi:hypothetical protein
MDETSPLILKQDNRREFPAPSSSKRSVVRILPSLEDDTARKDRYFSIRIGYICMFATSVSFTVCISSTLPFLKIVCIFNSF